MKIDLNVLARAGKLVAILGFFLPWVAVSCSGNEMARGNGFQMLTGHLEVAEQFRQQANEDGESALGEGDIEIVLALGLAAIVLGLLASLVLRQRAASGALLAGALLGLGLCYASFDHMRSAVVDASAESEAPNQAAPADPNDDLARSMAQMQSSMRESISNAITIEKQEGFWVTAAALIAAALLALASLSGVRVVMAEPTKQQASTP